MKVKASVVLVGACFEIGWAAGIATRIYETKFAGDMVLTSVRDSVHGSGSLHPKGKAMDIRTKDINLAQRVDFTQALQLALNPHGFDVLLESDHIHVEFDPKPGETFAKVTA